MISKSVTCCIILLLWLHFERLCQICLHTFKLASDNHVHISSIALRNISFTKNMYTHNIYIYIYDVYIYIPTVIWQISTMCCPFSWYFLVPPCNMPSPLHGVGPRLRSEVRRLEERMAEKEAEHKARGGNYGLLWLHHEKKWKWRLWAFKMHETWSFKMFVTVFPTNVILFSCV